MVKVTFLLTGRILTKFVLLQELQNRQMKLIQKLGK